MTGDFSRVTFRPANHYSGVLLQQGRVQLDADHNEQVDISAHRDRTAVRDLVGDAGTPWSADAFRIVAAGTDLAITPGRMYVDGIACELEGDPLPIEFDATGGFTRILIRREVDDRRPLAANDWVRVSGDGGLHTVVRIQTVGQNLATERLITLATALPAFAGVHPLLERVATYSKQPDYPSPPAATPGRYLVYLDVWHRLVTALERPEIREDALGGPDTAARSKVVWQVKLERVGSSPPPGDNCADFGAGWARERARPNSTLRAQVAAGTQPTNVCDVPTGGGYRRLENQLYRVAIHSQSGSKTRVKWSRDNATVVAKLGTINLTGADPELTVSDVGRDAVLRFAAQQLVEVADERQTLHGEPGVLMSVQSVEGNRLRVTAVPGVPFVLPAGFDATQAVVRRWDGSADVAANMAATDKWLELEDGLQVQLNDGPHRPGDYWLIPARTLRNRIEWPQDGAGVALPQPPHGVEHRYTALAIATLTGTEWTVDHDCRERFPALSELTALQYLSGDGQQAMPGREVAGPLRVAVTNGHWGVAGARVRFRVTKGAEPASGPLSAGSGAVSVTTQGAFTPAREVVVTTAADGTAQCYWRLASIAEATQLQRYPHQVVEAVLLDDDGAPDARVRPLVFNGYLSVASEVHFAPTGCPAPPVPTVQAALERLCSFTHLEYVGGDGQAALEKEELTYPLRVGVANGEGRVPGARVAFVAQGGGTLRATLPDGSTVTGSNIPVDTNNIGVAECWWTLGTAAQGDQVVTAELLVGAGDARIRLPILFTATILPPLAGGGTDAAVRIIRVLLGGQILRNDTNVQVNLFASAPVRIACDKPIDPRSTNGKPVVALVLEIPYPLSAADRETWGYGPTERRLVAYQPLVLNGEVRGNQNDVLWLPAKDATNWLEQRLFQKLRSIDVGRVLARLTLKGNFVWGQELVDDREVYIDGETGGFHDASTPAPHTALRLPSGDGVRGGDFEMWFWLVSQPRIAGFVITPATTTGNTAAGTVTLSSTPSERIEVTVEPTSGAIDSDTPLRPLVFEPGETSKSFQFTVRQWGPGGRVTLKASLGESAMEATLTRETAIASFTLNQPYTINDRAAATIGLTAPAVEPTTVVLTATGGAITPTSVTFDAGSQQRSVEVQVTRWDASDMTLRATLGNTTQDATLARVTITGFAVMPGILNEDDPPQVTGTVTLNRPAPAALSAAIAATEGRIVGRAATFQAGQTEEGNIPIGIVEWVPVDGALIIGRVTMRATLGTSFDEAVVRLRGRQIEPIDRDTDILDRTGPTINPVDTTIRVP